jgi:hypothetical protein
MIISLNNHWPHRADYSYPRTLPITPEVCLASVFDWLVSLKLPKDEVHTLVMPGVREGLVLTAYHTVMGHLPIACYSMRDRANGGYVWKTINLQDWRDDNRGRR